MFAKLYMTGKQFYHPTQYTKHDVNCTVNDTETRYTLADDELISLGVFKDGNLIGYFGRDCIVPDYRNAELINGRFEPKIKDAPKGTVISKIESFFFNKDTIRRNREQLLSST